MLRPLVRSPALLSPSRPCLYAFKIEGDGELKRVEARSQEQLTFLRL